MSKGSRAMGQGVVRPPRAWAGDAAGGCSPHLPVFLESSSLSPCPRLRTGLGQLEAWFHVRFLVLSSQKFCSESER